MMSSNGQKSKKIRPICKFCDHKPFRYESGLDWHLKNIHPVEYAAMTNRPAFVYVDGTTPHPDEDSGPVHMRQELDLTPTEKPPTPPPIQPLPAERTMIPWSVNTKVVTGGAMLAYFVSYKLIWVI